MKYNKETNLNIEEKFVSEFLSLLRKRGISESTIDTVFGEYGEYSNSMLNMDKASLLYIKQVIEGKKIGILYDVDMDGICGGTIVHKYTRLISSEPVALINKGKIHGITEDVVNACIKMKIELLICVDCGTNDIKYHKILEDKGIKVIILDHHEIEVETLNNVSKNTIIVNCKDGVYLNKDLSGTGVAYKFLKEVDCKINTNKVDRFKKYVGMSIFSDWCAMDSKENRYFASHLLYGVDKYPYFVTKFLNYGLNQNSFTFGVIPAVNALMRTNNNEVARDIFITKSESEIDRLYDRSILSISEQRFTFEKLLKSIKVKLLDEFSFTDITNVKTDKEFNKNLTGLLATKLKEMYKKPALVVYRNNGDLKGSFRGDGADFKKLFNDCGLLALGHDQAFGLLTTEKEFSNNIKSVISNFPKVTFNDKGDFDYDGSDLIKNTDFIYNCAMFNELCGKNLDKITFNIKLKKGAVNIQSYERYSKLNINGFTALLFDDSKFNYNLENILVYPLIDGDGKGFKFIVN